MSRIVGGSRALVMAYSVGSASRVPLASSVPLDARIRSLGVATMGCADTRAAAGMRTSIISGASMSYERKRGSRMTTVRGPARDTCTCPRPGCTTAAQPFGSEAPPRGTRPSNRARATAASSPGS